MRRKNSLNAVLLLISVSILVPFALQAAMTVEITAPVAGSRLVPCSDIELTANVTTEGETIKDVRFYYGLKQIYIARAQDAPYTATWENVPPGFYTIKAKVTDSDNNQVFSDSVGVIVGDLENGDIIYNGTFDCGTSPWRTNYGGGASATFEIDPDGYLADSTTAVITPNNPGTEDYHIQIYQEFPVFAGHTYYVSFSADASSTRNLGFFIQEANNGSYDIWGSETVELGTGNTEFGPYEKPVDVDDPTARFLFNIGGDAGIVYLDNVQVIDPQVAAVEGPNAAEVPTRLLLSQNFPNPFNAMTSIQYTLPEESDVTITIFDMTGKKIRTLVNDVQHTGDYQITWDACDHTGTMVPSGVYVYRLHAMSRTTSYTSSNTIVLTK